jgi:hypothetical protein
MTLELLAELFIKELVARGDLQRFLVCPGNLTEQWQDELNHRFYLPFEILTNDKLEAARTGNWFSENNLVIARLDNCTNPEKGDLAPSGQANPEKSDHWSYLDEPYPGKGGFW